MRGERSRRHHREDEEESVFVSMTDMMIGFLFIVILLLAYFSSQYNPEENVPLPVHKTVVEERDLMKAEVARLNALLAERVLRIARLEEAVKELKAELADLRKPNPLETYINTSMAERRRILDVLREQLTLDFPDVTVILSEESDALRFQGDGLFRSGASHLRNDRAPFVAAVARRLEALLPCYSLGAASRWNSDCNASHALIEAVQIEGHTDSDGSDLANMTLSTERANATFRVMTEVEPGLMSHLNFRFQPVLSVAGYGEMRPVSGNDSPEGKSTNRRIDLRIIMYVPSHSDEIEVVKSALVRTAND